MYKPFNLENLKQVRVVSFEPPYQTFWISTSEDGDAKYLINLGEDHQDDKTSLFNVISCGFVVRLLEQITGFKFEKQHDLPHNVVWIRTDQQVW